MTRWAEILPFLTSRSVRVAAPLFVLSTEVSEAEILSGLKRFLIEFIFNGTELSEFCRGPVRHLAPIINVERQR